MPADLDRNELFNRLYDELRSVASLHMAHERTDHTLQPTALVNEVYLRVFGNGNAWKNERHFFGAAAEAMRRILIDHARAHGRLRRGGDRHRVDLDKVEPAAPTGATLDIIALDEAVRRMEEEEPRMAEVVKLRFFAGLSIDDTARVMDVSPMTVKRAWSCAQAWLHGEVFGEDA